MIKNPKFFPLEKDVLDRSIFNLSRSENRLWYFEPEVINQAIDYSMGLPTHNRRKRNSKHPQFTLLSVRGVVGKLVFDDLPTLSKVSLSERACSRGLITTKASMKRMMSALKIFSMVQARKETPDHVSVQEECLNSSCPKEFSLVGIKSAILKIKNFGRGICKPIFLITG